MTTDTDTAKKTEEQEAAPPTTGRTKVTLQDQGYNMPVGIRQGNSLAKPFAFRRYKMAQDKNIARRINEFTDGVVPEAVKVTYVLSELLVTLGGEDIGEKKVEERDLQVFGLGFGDVMYIYIMARVESLGAEIKFPTVCHFCGDEFDFIGDLATLDIVTFQDPDSLLRIIELPTPWILHGKKLRRVLLQPAPWGSVHGKSETPVHFQARMFQGAIIGGDEKEGTEDPIESKFAVTPTDIDELDKRSINFLDAEVTKSNGGPQLELECICPHEKCGRRVVRPLGWDFDSFFG